ncbi:MAG: hypothetical protein U0174_16010 [Polyangiaceae bacterium]
MKYSVPYVLVSMVFASLGCSSSETSSGTSGTSSSSVDGGVPMAPDGAVLPGADAAAEADGGDAGRKTLLGPATSVSPACSTAERYSAYGDGGFEDGFYAITLAPPSYPFQAESISYTLKSGMVVNPADGSSVSCMASTPHKLGFFKAVGGKPTASPSDLQVWTSSGMGDVRTEKLPTSVILENGEVAVLLIQLVRSFSASCVRSCTTDVTPGANFRAPSISVPFAWSAYSPKGNLMLTLNGRPILE